MRKKTEIPDQTFAEQRLDSFKLKDRLDALEWLIAHCPCDQTQTDLRVNMHFHSFFSYNTNGYSPCHIAWESRKAGIYAAGLCDFDVLDGLEEFFTAGLMLELRTVVHLETRVFFKEYATVDITSPGEPGVTYMMGAGFVNTPDKNTPEAANLAQYRRQANDRNIALVQRINAHLPEIAIDYKNDVVPLTPAECPTERHIVRAYRLKAESAFPDSSSLHEFWAALLKTTLPETEKLLTDIPVFENQIRSALVKSGGVGYVKPTEQTFPPIDDFINWVLDCRAIPMITWLDGTSKGEENIQELLECMKAKGACAVNIIPDRNHNITDPGIRSVKLKNLAKVIKASERLGLPINIGTELNKLGQPFADDIQCEALRSYHETFLRGARIMVGHTWLSRFGGFSYTGEAAQAEFGNDILRKNKVFESVGSLPPVTSAIAARLSDMEQEKALDCIRNSASKNSWML